MKEIWKDIVGYERLYQISNLGRVKSLNYNGTKKEKVLKPTLNDNGYYVVYLYKNKRRKTIRVHRLVAETFISNSKNKPQVNHKDGNKQNNGVENLEWCTNQDNVRHAVKNGLCKYLKPVVCIENNEEYPSIIEAERKTNIPNSNIVNCCKGIYKTAGGYHWKYKDIA